MNNIYTNLIDSITDELKVFNLNEDVQFSISKIAIYLNRFLPGVASIWSRNYNEVEDN